MRLSTALFITIFNIALLSTSYSGDKYAIIISARSGNESLSQQNLNYCHKLRKKLNTLGFSPKKVTFFFEGGKKTLPDSEDVILKKIIEKLENLQKTLKPDDQLWIFLFGHANVNSRGISIATKGGRLKGKVFADFINTTLGKKFIFCFNTQSSALMPLLAKGKNFVVTATSKNSQLNPPILPVYFFEEWSTKSKTNWFDIFKNAGRKIEDYYTDRSLAITEISQIYDGKKITAYPFGNEKSSYVNPDKTPEEIPSPEAGAIKVSRTPKAAERFINFSTPGSRKIITMGQKLEEKYKKFPAFHISIDRKFVVNMDKSTVLTTDQKTFLVNYADAQKYVFNKTSFNPLENDVTIKKARIIYPDGRSQFVQPVKIVRSQYNHCYILKYPGAENGCVIEQEIIFRKKPNHTLPEFFETIIIQADIPIEHSVLNFKIPLKQNYKYKLYNAKQKPVTSKTEYSKILNFHFSEVPAYERLDNDPPQNDILIYASLSSFPSWSAFARWAQRLLEGVDVMDKETEKLNVQLTENAETDTKKLKAIYEYLAGLPYDTTPTGARRFRPRLPRVVCSSKYGDCKDKANALVTMAGALGIRGYIALVNRGGSTDVDFAGWQFNHAVAFFPDLEGFPDGLWCDATDGSTPFKSLPPGDIGRNALVLDFKKPYFKKITLPGTSVNSITQIAKLQRKGKNIKGNITFKATGFNDYCLRNDLKMLLPLQKKQFVQKLVNKAFTGLNLKNFSHSKLGNISEIIEINGEVSGKSWKLSEAYIGLVPQLWDDFSLEKRNRPLLLNDGQPFNFHQQISIHGKPTNHLPKNWSFTSSIFDASIKFKNNDKTWTRTLDFKLKQPLVPTDKYKETRINILELYENLLY